MRAVYSSNKCLLYLVKSFHSGVLEVQTLFLLLPVQTQQTWGPTKQPRKTMLTFYCATHTNIIFFLSPNACHNWKDARFVLPLDPWMPSTEAMGTIFLKSWLVVGFSAIIERMIKKQYVETFIVELKKCFYIVLVLAVKNHKIIFNDTFFLSFYFMIFFFLGS